jgi:hypothetical protein
MDKNRILDELKKVNFEMQNNNLKNLIKDIELGLYDENIIGVRKFIIEPMIDLGNLAKRGERRLACYWDGESLEGYADHPTKYIHLIDAEHINPTNNFEARKVLMR